MGPCIGRGHKWGVPHVLRNAAILGFIPEAHSGSLRLVDKYVRLLNPPFMACFSGVFVRVFAVYDRCLWRAVWSTLDTHTLTLIRTHTCAHTHTHARMHSSCTRARVLDGKSMRHRSQTSRWVGPQDASIALLACVPFI